MKNAFAHIKKTVQSFLEANSREYKNKHFLLGVSGGADSVLLVHVFHSLNLNFDIAHVNYSLRGKESDEDAIFVKNLAAKLKVSFHYKKINTKALKQKNESVQMLARDLRYTFFEEILEEEKINHLILAHHAGDQVETVLMNLFRGTGINGLTGIPEKNGSIYRPLLIISKKEIIAALKEKKHAFRTDSSNLKSDYKRNYLRNEILPLIEKKWPGLEKTILRDIENFKSLKKIFNDEAKYVDTVDFTTTFNINSKKLLSDLVQAEVFFQMASANKFNIPALKKILAGNSTETKVLHGLTGTLEIKGQTIYHVPNMIAKNEPSLKIQKNKVLLDNIDISFINKKEETICLKKIQGDLSLRKWQTGDKMIPLGMKGTKKISDILTDLKLTANQKKQVLILCDEVKPLWLVGFRIDNRVKLTGKETANEVLTLRIA
jgi:tRNA(Ile)-lysidine synthase